MDSYSHVMLLAICRAEAVPRIPNSGPDPSGCDLHILRSVDDRIDLLRRCLLRSQDD